MATTTINQAHLTNRNLYWGIAIAVLVVIAIAYAMNSYTSRTYVPSSPDTTTTTTEQMKSEPIPNNGSPTVPRQQ